MKAKTSMITVAQLIGLFCAATAWSHPPTVQASAAQGQNRQQSAVTVPARPQNSIYKGEQGPQRSEVEFTPSSRKVTIKLRVQDSSGYFVPDIRRENFAVYEDGVRQKDVDIEIEHAPVSLAVLVEFGGRYHELNKALAMTIPQACRHLVDVIGSEDKVSIFKYGSSLETLADFSQGRDALAKVLDNLETPGASEANFYDALLETIHRMQTVNGRKAIVVISSGVDTFSKASYEQVLQASRDAAIPIYTLGLASIMKQEADVYGPAAPFSRINWSGAEQRLEALANASGGRAYEPQSNVEFAAIFDDIMENLRLRYVITYVSSNPATSGQPRRIRVELIDSKTGAPMKIRDSTGKPISAKVFVQETYSPSGG